MNWNSEENKKREIRRRAFYHASCFVWQRKKNKALSVFTVDVKGSSTAKPPNKGIRNGRLGSIGSKLLRPSASTQGSFNVRFSTKKTPGQNAAINPATKPDNKCKWVESEWSAMSEYWLPIPKTAAIFLWQRIRIFVVSRTQPKKKLSPPHPPKPGKTTPQMKQARKEGKSLF